MALKTKYISVDDVVNYFPELHFRQAMGEEDVAISFIKRIEDRMATYIDSYFNKNVDYTFPEFTDYQKEHYKRALLEQVIYIFRNGDLSTDSGYDVDKGVIANNLPIISPNAIQELTLCGLWNRNVRVNLGWFRW